MSITGLANGQFVVGWDRLVIGAGRNLPLRTLLCGMIAAPRPLPTNIPIGFGRGNWSLAAVMAAQ
jgi:hypothetical protein